MLYDPDRPMMARIFRICSSHLGWHRGVSTRVGEHIGGLQWPLTCGPHDSDVSRLVLELVLRVTVPVVPGADLAASVGPICSSKIILSEKERESVGRCAI